MVRPRIQRRVGGQPSVRHFKPQGIPLAALEEVVLAEDEFEAIRLADVEGMYHDAAAKQMKVSRPTFGRILAQGRRAVATAITQGKAVRIEGGQVEHVPTPRRLHRGGGRGRCRRGWW
jgi:predicted DNA-binding protein (UPF0251 family)